MSQNRAQLLLQAALVSKAEASCSGLHQEKISQVGDATTPGALFPCQTNLTVKIVFLCVQSEPTMLQLAASGSGQSPASYRLRAAQERRTWGYCWTKKLDISWQHTLAAQATCPLGCTPSSVGSRPSEGIPPLCSTLLRPPLGVLRPALESPEKLECVHRRPQK